MLHKEFKYLKKSLIMKKQIRVFTGMILCFVFLLACIGGEKTYENSEYGIKFKYLKVGKFGNLNQNLKSF